MNILLLVVLLILLFGGGGFYFGGPVIGGSGLGLILLICWSSISWADFAPRKADRQKQKSAPYLMARSIGERFGFIN